MHALHGPISQMVKYQMLKYADTTNHVLGFIRRGENTALITGYRAETSMLIPAGFGVTLYDRGDF